MPHKCVFQVYDGGMEGLQLHPGSGFTDEITPAITLTANTGRMLVKFVSDSAEINLTFLGVTIVTCQRVNMPTERTHTWCPSGVLKCILPLDIMDTYNA